MWEKITLRIIVILVIFGVGFAIKLLYENGVKPLIKEFKGQGIAPFTLMIIVTLLVLFVICKITGGE